MSSVYKLLPNYTYEDWIIWEGKWELIDGIPYAMSPSPVPKHQKVAAEISTELILAMRKSNCQKCNVYQPIDYKISDNTILIPDILVVCGEIKKKFLDFAPLIVVEILSPSTALKDRNTKYQIYEQEKVKYYIIVDIDTKSIEIYQLVDEKYSLQNFNANFTFELQDDCSIDVKLCNIFA